MTSGCKHDVNPHWADETDRDKLTVTERDKQIKWQFLVSNVWDIYNIYNKIQLPATDKQYDSMQPFHIKTDASESLYLLFG